MIKKISLLLLMVICFNSVTANAFAAEPQNNDIYPTDQPSEYVEVDLGYLSFDSNNEMIDPESTPFDFDEIEIPVPTQSSGETPASIDPSVYVITASFQGKSNNQFVWTFNYRLKVSKAPSISSVATLLINTGDGTGSYSPRATTSVSSVAFSNNYTLRSTPQTGYYKFRFETKEISTGYILTGDTTKTCVNKSGVLWNFNYSDKGKSLPQPVCNWSKGAITSRDPNTAKNYYKDYKAATGKTLDSTKFDIHHIRPLAYGGSNNYDNLIHLPKDLHKDVTGWFNGY